MTGSSEMPRVVKDILGELALIGSLPTGYKLNTKSGSYADASSYLDSFKRTCSGESGNVTYDYINSKINEAVKIAIQHPKWRSYIKERIISLEDAIRNLKFVYAKSPALAEIIGTLLLRITPEAFDEACPPISLLVTSPVLVKSKSRSSAPNTPVQPNLIKSKRRIATSVPRSNKDSYNPLDDPYNDSDGELNCDGEDYQNLTESLQAKAQQRLELSEED
ncbi:MAG: hypothetical protein Solivirus7_2 [Solivirus sp.]|jgi:hypothetical protein|uniref:Uncharacterized protein n=1 Tax=Solivirus sp. TaxID=2487772 RepID=A0A3G5AHP1_9VIRU|nr:MAG: hypothetical protein Solivirus7_2 [Solivirus sp.]